MIGVLYNLTGRVVAMGEPLTPPQFDALPFLALFANGAGPIPDELGQALLVLSLTAAYAGAIFFVFHCRRKRLDRTTA
jgi:hypothetical protein